MLSDCLHKNLYIEINRKINHDCDYLFITLHYSTFTFKSQENEFLHFIVN